MSFRLYESYRESGVRWLGSVPSGWTVKAIKHCFSVVGGSTPKSEVEEFWDGEHVWVTPADLSGLSGFGIVDSARRITDAGLESCGTNLVPPGSIVLSTRAPIGSLAIAGTSLCTNQGCKSLVPKQGVVPRYFAYVLSIAGEELNLRGRGTTFLELSADALGAFEVVVPTAMEQVAIAAFLDRETAKIDALVEEQKRLIELLKEKRQAVISQAVTKGLDPSVPMKDSGVEWIGTLPSHWRVLRVKAVARLESGHTPSKQVPEYWENCDIPWVSLNDSKQLAASDYISETAFQINALGLENSSARMLPTESVVFTRDATIGLAAITTRPMAVSQHLIAWCPGKDIDALYLLRVFNVMKEWLDAATFGATIKTIGMADVKKLVTPVPPVAEQREIAAFIDKRKSEFDSLIDAAESATSLLRERRSALISAAVTGKIDVRGLVPQPEVIAA